MRAVETALDATSSGTPVNCSILVSVPLLQQGNWVTVRRHSRESKHQTGSPHSVMHTLRHLMKVL